jgi:hypothetical protein
MSAMRSMRPNLLTAFRKELASFLLILFVMLLPCTTTIRIRQFPFLTTSQHPARDALKSKFIAMLCVLKKLAPHVGTTFFRNEHPQHLQKTKLLEVTPLFMTARSSYPLQIQIPGRSCFMS